MKFEYSCKSTSIPLNKLKINDVFELNKELQSLSNKIKNKYDKWVYVSCSNSINLNFISFEIKTDSTDMLGVGRDELLKYIDSIYCK